MTFRERPMGSFASLTICGLTCFTDPMGKNQRTYTTEQQEQARKVIYVSLIALPVIGLLVVASFLHNTLGYVLQGIGTLVLLPLAYLSYRFYREMKGQPPGAS